MENSAAFLEMDSTFLGYVITIFDYDTKKRKYLAEDRDCGCRYWSCFISSAIIFKNKQEINKEFENGDFYKDSIMGDGTIYPPRLIHFGLGLNNSKTQGKGIIQVFPLELGKSVYDYPIESDLIKGRKNKN